MRVPKYLSIEEDLRKQIVSGTFESGDRFYSESELCRMYDASSITVIHAIKDLVSQGYLVRYQGKGTFVSRARKHKLVEFTDVEVFAAISDEEVVQVVSMEHQDDAAIRDILRLAPQEGYVRFVRVRSVQGTPYILQYSYIPDRYVRKDVEPSYYESIYTRLREDHGLHLNDEQADETDEIVMPAPDETRDLLGIGTDVPCVLQHKTTTLADGRVAEYVTSYKRWDFYKIEFSTYQRPTA
ncbi:MAG: GntR family transcriptional regulator [Atopobiaceae bacterium]|jgi:DNA-binding GntR family transcriptional regulator|nr:GntR family transcriptional regulator [Atopobiaceae bacterium]